MPEVMEHKRNVAEIESDIGRIRGDLEEMERSDTVEGRPEAERRLRELKAELEEARKVEAGAWNDEAT